MKKITIAIIALFGMISVASADLGINVGIATQVGVFHAEGVDTRNNTAGADHVDTEDATGVAGYKSFFIEKTLGRFITIGYDQSPDTLSSETATNVLNAEDTIPNAFVTQTNTVQLDFKDLTTMYVAINLTENLFIKFGNVNVDVVTNEVMETDSSYNDFSLDGDMYGIGFNKSFDNTMFIRVEAARLEFESHKQTSLDNTLEMKKFEGGFAKVSVGKSF
jgi:hypothetical protein